MSTVGTEAAPGPTPAERRSAHRFENRVELLATILLAVATVAASWSAFQATKWSGVQANSYASAGATRTEASQAHDRANAQTVVDVNTFLAWVQAVSSDHDGLVPTGGTYHPRPGTLSAFLYARFRPEFEPAVQAWVATHPLKNPHAPPTPFVMPEYVLAEATLADRLTAKADGLSAKARAANQTADNFVLLTVMFAAVLFFAGVSTKFEIHRNRLTMLALASVLLVATVGVLVSFPETF
jgi:hypothetical protein